MKNKITKLTDLCLMNSTELFCENNALLASTTNNILEAIKYQYAVTQSEVTVICGLSTSEVVINTVTNATRISRDTLKHLRELRNESGFGIACNIRNASYDKIAWIHMTPHVPEHRRNGDTSETTTEVYSRDFDGEWNGYAEDGFGEYVMEGDVLANLEEE